MSRVMLCSTSGFSQLLKLQQSEQLFIFLKRQKGGLRILWRRTIVYKKRKKEDERRYTYVLLSIGEQDKKEIEFRYR